jgi:hypothetical protein
MTTNFASPVQRTLIMRRTQKDIATTYIGSNKTTNIVYELKLKCH